MATFTFYGVGWFSLAALYILFSCAFSIMKDIILSGYLPPEWLSTRSFILQKEQGELG
jgi:hypothetical protein